MSITVRALIEQRDAPVTIEWTRSAREALDVMLEHDYTQLPVVDGSVKVVGLVTQAAILQAIIGFRVSVNDLIVRHAMEDPKTADPDDELSELFNGLRDHYAVLVVEGAGQLVGIVTGYDAAEYFRKRSQDLLLVEDIETTIRDCVRAGFMGRDGRLDEQALVAAISAAGDISNDLRKKFRAALKTYLMASGVQGIDESAAMEAFQSKFGAAGPKGFESLTFKQYVDVLFYPSCWTRARQDFGDIDERHFRNLLDGVREVRNALAHFREIAPSDRAKVRKCAMWFKQAERARHRLEKSGPTITEPLRVTELQSPLSPVAEVPRSSDSKYASLAEALQTLPDTAATQTYTFGQVESVIGDRLPNSAREHRSWWANDSTSHPQSREWLDVGWRVSTVNLLAETVVFERIRDRQRAYIEFFSKSLALLKAEDPTFRPKNDSPLGVSWHVFDAYAEGGRQAAMLVQSFARGERFRVELYIDTGEQSSTKQIFDRLASRRDRIEGALGEPLSWERMEGRRASRIALYRAGYITAPAETVSELLRWGADILLKCRNLFATEFSAAVHT